ncbi:MAG: DNA repair protein RecN [Acidobacteria bacterium]|nr:DNA repair protein RecN [Acidobacteriota bacterium]
MLEFLKVKNIALIDEIEIEFGDGLNLLTGETGSCKSIIVDSLGTLTGERVSSDLIKSGQQSARIEGIFTVGKNIKFRRICDEAGIDLDESDSAEVIVRRELSASGKNRIFINGQLSTQAVLKQLGPHLVAIHGQGEHTELFNPSNHLEILDVFAESTIERKKTADAFSRWNAARQELIELRSSDAEKLQLLDVLRFQIDEIDKADIKPGEDEELGEAKLRLNNVEKLSNLSSEIFALLYDDPSSSAATLEKATRKIEELAQYDSKFAEYIEGLKTAAAVVADLAVTARDFGGHLEFSPERLEQIETRLAEISRLTRKYGGTIDSVLTHFTECKARLETIETSELREKELVRELSQLEKEYLTAATTLHDKRVDSAGRFEKKVEANLKAVALEKAKFVVDIKTRSKEELASEDLSGFSPKGIDTVEFLFSANAGEGIKPLARIASGGESSRLMLILKTTAGAAKEASTAVFDEIDAGIGGRVAEAVGLKLKALAASQQVLCVTHQPQVASKADLHFVIEKSMKKNSTSIAIRELSPEERIEELARMLAGEKVTEAARENAREMIAAAS